MKIISKYKDYYDYLQGIYGIDEKIVYRRQVEIVGCSREWKNIWTPSFLSGLDNNKTIPYHFAICGELYSVIWHRGKLIHTLKEYDELVESGDIELAYYDRVNLHLVGKYKVSTKLNDKLNCPIIHISYSWGRLSDNGHILNPKLSDFNFSKVIKPEDMYLKLSTYLSREPIITDSRTDTMKLESYGFDKKHSFRNTK